MDTAVNTLTNKAFIELLLFFVSGILIARFSSPLIQKF